MAVLARSRALARICLNCSCVLCLLDLLLWVMSVNISYCSCRLCMGGSMRTLDQRAKSRIAPPPRHQHHHQQQPPALSTLTQALTRVELTQHTGPQFPPLTAHCSHRCRRWRAQHTRARGGRRFCLRERSTLSSVDVGEEACSRLALRLSCSRSAGHTQDQNQHRTWAGECCGVHDGRPACPLG